MQQQVTVPSTCSSVAQGTKASEGIFACIFLAYFFCVFYQGSEIVRVISYNNLAFESAVYREFGVYEFVTCLEYVWNAKKTKFLIKF